MRKTNCAVCEARCPFGSLSLHERFQLNSLIRHHRYEKGETILRKGL
ncbi:MAG: hypothetical protein NZ930_03220 [Candidatus Bipolaricaulota bacterium]|nr:hypothetical protein [Candidatus Bipolaricaulota bacterium]MDW8030708.1 hypothetical protein [Candidatus Bipolaricaulota bacterium]